MVIAGLPELGSPAIPRGPRRSQFSIYRTRAIISRGLYVFLHHFKRPFMYCDLWPYVWLVFKSGFYSRAAYDGARTVYVQW